MSDVSSKPASAAEQTARRRANKLPVVFEAIGWGLILYIVPALLAVAVLTGLFAVLGLITPSATDILDGDDGEATSQFVASLVTYIFTVIIIGYVIRRLKGNWQTIGLRRPAIRDIAYVGLGIVLYLAVASVLSAVVSQLRFIDSNQRQELGFDQAAGGLTMWLAFVTLVILAPLIEEILFRGFLYSRLRRAFRVAGSAVIVSLLFAILHLQLDTGNAPLWTAAIDTFGLSLILVYLREKTGTIWAGIGLHSLKNLAAFLVLSVFQM